MPEETALGAGATLWPDRGRSAERFALRATSFASRLRATSFADRLSAAWLIERRSARHDVISLLTES